jgi:hypothetical protein
MEQITNRSSGAVYSSIVDDLLEVLDPWDAGAELGADLLEHCALRDTLLHLPPAQMVAMEELVRSWRAGPDLTPAGEIRHAITDELELGAPSPGRGELLAALEAHLSAAVSAVNEVVLSIDLRDSKVDATPSAVADAAAADLVADGWLVTPGLRRLLQEEAVCVLGADVITVTAADTDTDTDEARRVEEVDTFAIMAGAAAVNNTGAYRAQAGAR